MGQPSERAGSPACRQRPVRALTTTRQPPMFRTCSAPSPARLETPVLPSTPAYTKRDAPAPASDASHAPPAPSPRCLSDVDAVRHGASARDYGWHANRPRGMRRPAQVAQLRRDAIASESYEGYEKVVEAVAKVALAHVTAEIAKP